MVSALARSDTLYPPTCLSLLLGYGLSCVLFVMDPNKTADSYLCTPYLSLGCPGVPVAAERQWKSASFVAMKLSFCRDSASMFLYLSV